MSVAARLQKVTQNLSPLQRAVLVLQAVRDGREPDPDLRKIDDPVGRVAFNRYMAVLWIVDHQLGTVLNAVTLRLEAAEMVAYQHDLLNEAAGLVEEQEGVGPAKARRNWRDQEEITVPSLLRGVALESRHRGVQAVSYLWQELIAIRSLWAELAREFAGEEPVSAELRSRADEAEAALRALAVRLKVRLPVEPTVEVTDAYRALVNESFRRLGMVEL
jgi:hypothetical protein